jgi:hypothetical protein
MARRTSFLEKSIFCTEVTWMARRSSLVEKSIFFTIGMYQTYRRGDPGKVQ